MHIEFVGRDFTITAKHRASATDSLQRIFPKIPKATGARIVLELDKYRNIAEAELTGPGVDFVARCEAKDMEQALHDTMRKLEQQVIHHNQRSQTVRDHQKPVTVGEAEEVESSAQPSQG